MPVPLWRLPGLGHYASSWVLIGPATVMGTLMYGAGHVRAGRANFYLHDYELGQSPSDGAFIDMLKQNCCLAGGLQAPRPPPSVCLWLCS